jgi:hypothetical protein
MNRLLADFQKYITVADGDPADRGPMFYNRLKLLVFAIGTVVS